MLLFRLSDGMQMKSRFSKIQIGKILFLYALPFLIPFSGNTQIPDFELKGSWMGYITQVPTGISDRYYFETHFELSGKDISGYSVIRIEEEMEIFGKIRLNGIFNGETITITEREITSQKIYSYAYWCLKQIQLEPFWEKDKWVLKGSWSSDMCTGTGEIHLNKMDVF